MTQKQSGGKQNTYSRLLLTQRQHACSIHINTQYQIMTPSLQAVDSIMGFSRHWTTGKCPCQRTKCLVLGKPVYQNMLLFFRVNMPRVVL